MLHLFIVKWSILTWNGLWWNFLNYLAPKKPEYCLLICLFLVDSYSFLWSLWNNIQFFFPWDNATSIFLFNFLLSVCWTKKKEERSKLCKTEKPFCWDPFSVREKPNLIGPKLDKPNWIQKREPNRNYYGSFTKITKRKSRKSNRTFAKPNWPTLTPSE